MRLRFKISRKTKIIPVSFTCIGIEALFLHILLSVCEIRQKQMQNQNN